MDAARGGEKKQTKQRINALTKVYFTVSQPLK